LIEGSSEVLCTNVLVKYLSCSSEVLSASVLVKTEIMALGIRRADYATPFCPQKVVLISLTSGSRSVGIVRSRT
jgi:hypothetical protein